MSNELDQWQESVGSEITVEDGEDREEHAKRIAEITQDTPAVLNAPPCSRSAMYWAWVAFVDIRRDRFHEFPSYESWIVSNDAECRSFRQGWAAMGAIMRDPNRYSLTNKSFPPSEC